MDKIQIQYEAIIHLSLKHYFVIFIIEKDSNNKNVSDVE